MVLFCEIALENKLDLDSSEACNWKHEERTWKLVFYLKMYIVFKDE